MPKERNSTNSSQSFIADTAIKIPCKKSVTNVGLTLDQPYPARKDSKHV